MNIWYGRNLAKEILFKDSNTCFIFSLSESSGKKSTFLCQAKGCCLQCKSQQKFIKRNKMPLHTQSESLCMFITVQPATSSSEHQFTNTEPCGPLPLRIIMKTSLTSFLKTTYFLTSNTYTSYKQQHRDIINKQKQIKVKVSEE